MTISSSDTTLALRIFQALQKFFDRERILGPMRFNEVYDFLVCKGMIEWDRHQGIRFRELYLIKQNMYNKVSHFIMQK
ncbi:MAG: hypothetical protein ACXIUQ_18890 [Cecembia sp.]